MLVSSGSTHTCGLRHDGSAQCWGQEGGSRSSTVIPKHLASEAFIFIDGGSHHVCALRPDNTPFCWGRYQRGQTSPPRENGS